MGSSLTIRTSDQEGDPAGWALAILNGIDTLLYLVAMLRGEKPADTEADEEAARCFS
jgi:hypothetical protein